MGLIGLIDRDFRPVDDMAAAPGGNTAMTGR